MVFKEHGLMLYMDAEIQVALVQLRADKHLGRSYAGLLALTEGLHTLGYLNEEQYKTHRKKYTIPIDEKPKQLTLEESKKAEERKLLEKQFAQIIEQWDLHPDKTWREHWTRKAHEYGDLVNARKLLAFVEARKTVKETF